ncbi:MAG TPA: thiol:disulfide interchange protein DsbA/DsbL [Rhodanobacteraceae bacterium]
MHKRFLLLAPLTLALTACGSSGNHGAPAAAPAGTVAAPSATAAAPTPTATTTPAPASTPSAAASTGTGNTTPAAPAANHSATMPASGNQLSATDKAAMVKAAKNFVPSSQWVEGANYFLIQPQQPKVGNTDKVEVAEVFNWGCPACNEAHTIIDKMEAALPSYATMDYLAAGFRPDENWTLYQRAWFTAKALGLGRKSYNAMFDANWKTGVTGSYNLASGTLNPRSKWPHLDTVATFFHKTYGVPVKQFVAIANSFAINTQLKRADELVKDYGVLGTPTLIVDGRYRFDFRSAGGYGKGVELAKYLVAMEAKRIVDQAQSAK